MKFAVRVVYEKWPHRNATRYVWVDLVRLDRGHLDDLQHLSHKRLNGTRLPGTSPKSRVRWAVEFWEMEAARMEKRNPQTLFGG